MKSNNGIVDQLFKFVKTSPEISMGITHLSAVIKGPSYPASGWDPLSSGLQKLVERVSESGGVSSSEISVLVLGLIHPKSRPELDWWAAGNTRGNLQLMAMSRRLIDYLGQYYHRKGVDIPYHLEKGGIFLKDAAVLSGLGVIGRNNLLIHPQWGPRLRLRAILIEGLLPPTPPIDNLLPCDTCEGYCHKACPMNAFETGHYERRLCNQQMETDRANRRMMQIGTEPDTQLRETIIYCRACELACPLGRKE